MNTRRTIAFLLALVPASRLVAQDSAPLASDVADAKGAVIAADTARPIPPVLYPTPVPYEVTYANCDGSTVFPTVNANDIVCYFNRLAVGDAYANCDGSTTKPLITANDFICYLNVFSIATQWEYTQTLLDR